MPIRIAVITLLLSSLILGISQMVKFSPAFAMSSTNYRIDADNIGSGGDDSLSSTYRLGTDLGEAATGGRSISANYGIETGYYQEVNTTLTLTLGSSSVSFGSVNPGASTTQTNTANVTTDAWNGYSLGIKEEKYDGTYCCEQLTHTGDKTTTVSDHSGTIASPTAMGAGAGFGFSISTGTCVDSKWNSGSSYAAAPTTSTEFHNTGRQYAGCPGFKAPATGADTTTLQYKFAPALTQKSGTYQNKVTITATGSL